MKRRELLESLIGTPKDRHSDFVAVTSSDGSHIDGTIKWRRYSGIKANVAPVCEGEVWHGRQKMEWHYETT